MASVEEVITELKRLRPEQVDEIARIVRDLSQDACEETPLHRAMSADTVDDAVQNGWPAELFTQLIGSIPDLERSAQPPPRNPADW
jgi:hypothetical protein